MLTPLGALVGLAAALPLAALHAGRRRASAARASLGLAPATARRDALAASSIVLLGLLCAAAATQPAVRSVGRQAVRTDAAAYIAFDTSRSMLASGAPGAPTRIERARAITHTIRERLPDVPVGVLSFSDRLLPHLFPSPDMAAFAGVVRGPIRGGHPSPIGGYGPSSSLSALATIGDETLFLPATTRRALVVLTDAESSPLDRQALRVAFARSPRVAVAVVRVGNPRELVFDSTGVPEPQYRPEPAAPRRAAELAEVTRGRLFGERDAAGVAGWVGSRLGTGGRVAEVGLVITRRELAPWLLGAAALPLGVLLLLRNVPLGGGGFSFAATLATARRRSSVG